MALTSKLDLTRPDQRGLANGLNEFCGYFAVALASFATAYLADRLGARVGLFVFGLSVIIPALLLALTVVRDTRPWAEMEERLTPSPSEREGRGEGAAHIELSAPDPHPSPLPSRERGSRFSTFGTLSVIKLTWRDRTFFAVCQAGLVEKFTDALMWLFVPALLHQRGVDLVRIGWISSAYTATWGFSQLFTGPLSDRIGRKRPIAAGMFVCAAGVAMMLSAEDFAWWIGCAIATGFGMALLYPNLGAAVSDMAPPTWRGSALGVYRFWRDLGLAIGAAGLAVSARWTGMLESAFWVVAICMMISGTLLWMLARETHPGIREVKKEDAAQSQ
jgi:MFS family permease